MFLKRPVSSPKFSSFDLVTSSCHQHHRGSVPEKDYYYMDQPLSGLDFPFINTLILPGTALNISNFFYFYPPTNPAWLQNLGLRAITALVRRQVSIPILESLKFNGHKFFLPLHLPYLFSFLIIFAIISFGIQSSELHSEHQIF